MGSIVLERVSKVFDGGVRAVDDVSLEVADGEFMVLVGPSGCGKSTLLRLIAGLEKSTAGRVVIGGDDVTRVAPPDRDIAMVFQNYALYPHMTVRQNLAFGLRQRRTERALIASRVAELSSMLGLEELLERRPSQLSGGQRQRVAIGRALVREPRAFLLDEPLSNLDAKLRSSMRAELARLHDRLGVTTVYVTHDQIEAMTLGTRVAVLRDGAVQQCDAPQVLFRRPANLFVAAFIGSPAMNLVAARVEDGAVGFAGLRVPLPPGSPLLGAARDGGSRDVILGVRPTAFAHADERADPDWPRLSVPVELVEELGDEAHVAFTLDAPPVSAEAVRAAADVGDDPDEGRLLLDDRRTRWIAAVDGRRRVAAGSIVELAVNAAELHAFDPASGRRSRATSRRCRRAERTRSP